MHSLAVARGVGRKMLHEHLSVVLKNVMDGKGKRLEINVRRVLAGEAVKSAAEQLGIGPNESRSGDKAGYGTEVVYRRVSDIKAKPIRWLWPRRIARGKVFMLAGHPGLGKSQATSSMTAIVTTGGSWPVDRTTKCERGSVIILSAEDDAEDTIRPRLEAAGADLTRVYILDAVRVPDGDGATRLFDLTGDIGRLGEMAERIGDVVLIVIDPVTAYLGDVDSHKNAEVRGVLAPLAAMAAERGIAIVCVSHLNKAGGTEALLRVMGSLGFVAAARGAYLVTKDPDDDDRRLFLPMKNNIAKDRGGLAFRVKGKTLDGGIETSCVEWDAESVVMTADEAMASDIDPDGETTARTEAEDWLRETLKGGDGMDGKRLKELASDSGIKERTLYRAAKDIDVVTLCGGFGKPRRWHLCPAPGKGCHVCQLPKDGAKPPTHDDVGTHGEPTPPKPSCDAGSAHVCHPPNENAGSGTHGSNIGVVRVPGGSDVHVCQGVVDGDLKVEGGMAEIRGWLQKLGEDPETISEVLAACARDPGLMAGYLRSTRGVS
jgi:putative DNA primase/helicase